jgi:hypothetical protein
MTIPIGLTPRVRAPDVETPAQELHNRLVVDEARKLRARRDARALVDAEHQEPAPPFDAGTLADILQRPTPPRDRVDGLIPWEASTLLTSMRKTGKTTTVGNLTESCLTGRDFLGKFGVRKLDGDVAFLNYEVSAWQLARWMHDMRIPQDRLFMVNLRGRRNPLSHPDDRERLAKLLRDRGTEMIIVDPFGRAYSGTSQNDAGEVGAWLVQLDQFVRGDVGAKDLILTAHAGWNGERTRGSSALEDWADAVLTLTKDDTDDGDAQRYIRAFGRDVELDEDRLNYDHETRTLTLSGAGGRRQAKASRHHADLDAAVLAAITTTPGLNGSKIGPAIRDTIGFQRGEERQAAQRLVDTGKARIEIGPRGAKNYFPTTTYPDLSQPLPVGQVTTYPDPSLKGREGWDTQTSHHLSRDTCRTCGQPMTITDPGQTTHPTCQPTQGEPQ